jgi:hypothetical protein
VVAQVVLVALVLVAVVVVEALLQVQHLTVILAEQVLL